MNKMRPGMQILVMLSLAVFVISVFGYNVVEIGMLPYAVYGCATIILVNCLIKGHMNKDYDMDGILTIATIKLINAVALLLNKNIIIVASLFVVSLLELMINNLNQRHLDQKQSVFKNLIFDKKGKGIMFEVEDGVDYIDGRTEYENMGRYMCIATGLYPGDANFYIDRVRRKIKDDSVARFLHVVGNDDGTFNVHETDVVRQEVKESADRFWQGHLVMLSEEEPVKMLEYLK